MKRRSETTYIRWTEYEVLKDIDHEKLKLIGAISLEWNFIEDRLDETVGVVLQLNPDIAFEVTSRINGLDGKFAIIKKSIDNSPFFTKEEMKLLNIAIDGMAEHKTYRDAVIHARVGDPKSDIALYRRRRGASDDILLSVEMLDALYERMTAVGHELTWTYRILESRTYDDWDLIPEGEIDPKQVRASPYFQDVMSQLRKHQKHRLSLPPLPKFPDSPEDHPVKVEPKETLDRS